MSLYYSFKVGRAVVLNIKSLKNESKMRENTNLESYGQSACINHTYIKTNVNFYSFKEMLPFFYLFKPLHHKKIVKVIL